MMREELLRIVSLCMAFCLLLAGCKSGRSQVELQSTVPVQEPPQGEENISALAPEEENTMLQMKIGNTDVAVDWEANETVEALRNLCRDTPLTIQLSMYGGFEQVGSIGQSLPRDDIQMTTRAGDIVLYSGNQIVVFYGPNSWATPNSATSLINLSRKWRNCLEAAMLRLRLGEDNNLNIQSVDISSFYIS